MNWGNFVGVVGYNETWRKYRRMMHVWLNKQAVPAFYQSQQHQARLLLQSLLDRSTALSTSEELNLEFYKMVSSTLLQSIYGYRPQSIDDVFVVGMKDVALKFGKAATPSNFMVNIFPALIHIPDWFPGTSWKTMLQEWGKQKDEVSDGLLNWTKRQIAAGNDDISMVASFLKDADKWGSDKAEVNSIIKEVGVGLFGGGTETTVDTLVVFILAMLLFPEVQAKAQKEIDGVVGTGRLPTMDDQPNLPYVRRLIQEVLRWQPVAPLGIPHVCSEDNEYQGYRIPKGAIVLGNVWAMSRDEKFYKDPEIFDPDRYLETSVPLIPAFGWGRRICAGLHYANSSLFISIVSLLAVFDISMRKDETGQYIIPKTKCAENTLAYHPKPFKLKVTPRSEVHAELIRSAVDLHPRL